MRRVGNPANAAARRGEALPTYQALPPAETQEARRNRFFRFRFRRDFQLTAITKLASRRCWRLNDIVGEFAISNRVKKLALRLKF